MTISKVSLLLLAVSLLSNAARAQDVVTFEVKESRLHIRIDERPFATYVWEDRQILRPYFTAVHAPNGRQITRSHPPVSGKDAVDHATMHPGIWLAFGDISGADFWRNKASVQHVAFVEKPATNKAIGRFVVRNRYTTGERFLCEEVCTIAVRSRPGATLLDWTSEFRGPEEFFFGDQEEMGLGIRLATPLTVKNGGQILNSAGLKNEKQVWGKPSQWCDYSGTIDGSALGLCLMPHPENFRRSWFHVRDYGLLVANPFGQNAFTRGEKSRIAVRKGDKLRLRFGILVHAGEVDLPKAYREWLAEEPKH